MTREPWHPPEVRLTELIPGLHEGRLADIGDGEVACDFCSDRRVASEYPCRDFKIGELIFTHPSGEREHQEHWNRGGFLACMPCSRLIDQGQYALLLIRMTRLWQAKHGGVEADSDAFIAVLAGFAKHRQGPGRDYPPRRGGAAG